MSKDEVKSKVHQAYDESLNRGNITFLDEIFDSEMVDNSVAAVIGEIGLAGFKSRVMSHRKGIPDLKFTIESMIVEKDMVAFRWTFSGTHSGPWLGWPGTGRTFTMSGMNLEKFRDEKIIEHWSFPDVLGAISQLGFSLEPGHGGI
jgi:steroid delta-isomerase-like uncharacterized protein